jgi:hypothetical protein
MHFYGGGYSDIKKCSNSWINAFNEINNNNGYREDKQKDIAIPELQVHYLDLIGNCCYICLPNTSFTLEWYSQMLSFMDSIYPDLIKNPATRPDDRKEYNTGYPIEWNQLLGRIFHKIVFKYKNNVLYSLPKPICINYK